MKNNEMKVTQIQVHTVVLLHSTSQRQLCHIEKMQLYNVSVSKLGAVCYGGIKETLLMLYNTYSIHSYRCGLFHRYMVID